eukprot:2037034-Amphidinium_carterae.2
MSGQKGTGGKATCFLNMARRQPSFQNCNSILTSAVLLKDAKTVFSSPKIYMREYTTMYN